MKIVLYDVQTRPLAINKTMAGGYGTSSNYSENASILIKILKLSKRKSVKIPLIDLAYLAAIFKNQGHEVLFRYDNGQVFPKADVYLIYGSLVEFQAEIQTAKRIKKTYPHAKIGFIGLFPMVKPEYFTDHADFVIKGESDSFFLKNTKDLKSLEGMQSVHLLENIDELPFPDWSRFPMNQFIHGPYFGKMPVYPVLSSRGCPLSCRTYCAYPLMAGGKVRFRDTDHIIEELVYLKKLFGAKAILFRDPTFTLHKDRIVKLCNKMIDVRLGLKWVCETHPAYLDQDLLDLMYKSGNRAIEMGIETRDANIIKQIKRHDTEESHLQKIVKHCDSIGIKVLGQYILGNPGETYQTATNTIDYAIRLNTSFAQFSVSTPYPGTAYYESLKDKLTTHDWTKFDTFTLVFEHPHISFDMMEKLKQKAYTQYYYRPKWIFGKYLKGMVRDFFDRG